MINHLWQSTLFAGLAALLTLALRGNPARTRYWVWFAASAKFLVPFSLLVALGQQVHLPLVQVQAVKIPILLEQIAQPIGTSPVYQQQLAADFALVQPTITEPPISLQPLSIRPSARPARGINWSSVLLAIWGCGSLFVTLRWGREWLRLRAILRSGHPVDLGLPLRAILSPTLREPGVFGVFRPVLLLPQGILEALAPEELRAVLIHEVTHVRRRDNLFAAIHMATEAIFWFHPVVWWIGRRMIEERERACDEQVLQEGNAPSAYAEGILKVCEHYLESPLACASGVTGADLKQRIREIMQHRIVRNLNLGKKALLCAAGAIAIALPIAVGTAVNLLHPPPAKAQSIPPAATPAPATPIAAAQSALHETPAQELPQAKGPSADGAIDAIPRGSYLRAAVNAVTGGQTQSNPRGTRTYPISPRDSTVGCAQQALRLTADEASRIPTTDNPILELERRMGPLDDLSLDDRNSINQSLREFRYATEHLKPTPFEAVSIRAHMNPASPAAVSVGDVPLGFMRRNLDSPRVFSNNRLALQNVTITDLIADAYCVQSYQVVLGAAGAALRNEKYDLTATVPESVMVPRSPYTSDVQLVRGMLQIALADRFHLKLHPSTGERAVYKLVKAPGGLKMHSIALGDSGQAEPNNRRQSLAELFHLIEQRADRAVLDETGLFGSFEYSLDFTRAIGDASDTTAIYSAVQEYLGLKLEAVKLMEPTLVVDSVEPPSEN